MINDLDMKYNEEELDSPETLEAVETLINSQIENNSDIQLNRAQRRALAKKAGKRGRAQLEAIGETAKKLDYIDLIQKLRKMNEEKEKENNETITENC